MGSLLLDPVIHHQIAADIARWNIEQARRADKYLRMILTHTKPSIERLFCRRRRACLANRIRHIIANARRQIMQQLESGRPAQRSISAAMRLCHIAR